MERKTHQISCDFGVLEPKNFLRIFGVELRGEESGDEGFVGDGGPLLGAGGEVEVANRLRLGD